MPRGLGGHPPRRRGAAGGSGAGDDLSQTRQAAIDLISEPGIEHQIGQLRIAVVSVLNALKQTRSNDAATFPDLGNRRHVQRIVEIPGGDAQELHALGVAGDAAEHRGIHQRGHTVINCP